MASLLVFSTLIFGSTLFICNIVAGIAIFLAMRRRNKTFVLIGAMLTADALFGLASAIYGMDIMRVLSEEEQNTQVSYFSCVLKPRYLSIFFTVPLSALMPLALSINRLFAVFAPFAHRHHSVALSYGLIAFAIAISSAFLGFYLVDKFFTPGTVSMACALSQLLSYSQQAMRSVFRITVTTSSVIAYIPVIVKMRQQLLSPENFIAKNQLATNSNALNARKLNRSAACNVVNTFLLFNVPDIFLFIYGNKDDNVIALCFALLNSRGIVSTFLFFALHDELRQIVRTKIYEVLHVKNQKTTLISVHVASSYL